jgi:hypothetical protein
MYPAAADANSFKVIEDIVAAQAIVGVSEEGTDFFPTSDTDHYTGNNYAAVAGENVKVFAVGEQCLVELGGTVNCGDYLKANATTDGKAIQAPLGTSGQQVVGGIALQYGVSGQKIRMLVQPGVIYHA